jgi:hypothetical protein
MSINDIINNAPQSAKLEPVNTLSFTLLGTSNTNIEFNLITELLLWEEVAMRIQQTLQGTTLSGIRPFGNTINFNSALSMDNQVLVKKRLIEAQRSRVQISGKFTMENTSVVPVIATVYASTVRINTHDESFTSYLPKTMYLVISNTQQTVIETDTKIIKKIPLEFAMLS